MYGTLLPMSLAALTVLAQALVQAAPRDLPALPKRALAKLAQLGQSGQVAQINRQRAHGQRPEEKRAVDVRADRAVGFVRQRLEHYSLLEVEEFPLAPRAAELGALLFPDGLSFLLLPYVEQLAAMEVLQGLIDKDKLVADLQVMCGADIVNNLRQSLVLYRAMVHGSLQKADETENLHDYRNKLSAAIVNYATKVAALYEEEDEQSLERVRGALRPIDLMRAQLSPKPGPAESEPSEPAEPGQPAPDSPAPTPEKP